MGKAFSVVEVVSEVVFAVFLVGTALVLGHAHGKLLAIARVYEDLAREFD